MSARVIVAFIFLIAGCVWTLRRPIVGIMMIIAFFHLNLRVFSAGLEDIRFQYYATIALMLSYFINLRSLREQPSPIRLPIIFLGAFLGIGFITSTWAVASTSLAFESTVDFAKVILFAVLMTQIIKTEKDFHKILWVCLAGVWYTAFMARWGVEWDWIDELEIGVATGGTGTHLAMFIPLLILFILIGTKKEKIAAFCIAPFVLDGMTVLPEGSRATFLNLVLTAGFFLLLAPRNLRKKSLVPFAVGAAIFILVLAPPGYFDYMKTILDPSQESSAASRSVINQASMQIIADYPQGIGYNNYSLISMAYMPEEVLTEFGTRDAHNSYFKVATEFGIIGFLLWISAFIAALVLLRRVRKDLKPDASLSRLQLYAFALAAGLLGIAPGIATHNYNDLDTLYWFVAFSCIVYNLHQLQQDHSETKSASDTGEPLAAAGPAKKRHLLTNPEPASGR